MLTSPLLPGHRSSREWPCLVCARGRGAERGGGRRTARLERAAPTRSSTLWQSSSWAGCARPRCSISSSCPRSISGSGGRRWRPLRSRS